MSNNIIDTVTQAVNSLVSALKLPDESAKANDTLGSMNFPQFSRILPYKDYDSVTGLFINNKTVGFMFEARPSSMPPLNGSSLSLSIARKACSPQTSTFSMNSPSKP